MNINGGKSHLTWANKSACNEHKCNNYGNLEVTNSNETECTQHILNHTKVGPSFNWAPAQPVNLEHHTYVAH
jgi:hypothetical protein